MKKPFLMRSIGLIIVVAAALKLLAGITVILFPLKLEDIPEINLYGRSYLYSIFYTVALNEKQQQYIKRQKKTVFYASVIVRSNEELAEKLLAEQESFF